MQAHIISLRGLMFMQLKSFCTCEDLKYKESSSHKYSILCSPDDLVYSKTAGPTALSASCRNMDG